MIERLTTLWLFQAAQRTLKEITPATDAPRTFVSNITGTTALPSAPKSVMLSFDAQPAAAKKGKFGNSFLRPAHHDFVSPQPQRKLFFRADGVELSKVQIHHLLTL